MDEGEIFCAHGTDQIRSDQIRSDQIRIDQIRPPFHDLEISGQIKSLICTMICKTLDHVYLAGWGRGKIFPPKVRCVSQGPFSFALACPDDGEGAT